jgi:hypothetical protein
MSSSSKPILLLALAACNQVFGLHESRERDGGQYDAPLDAPFACPPIGGTPPSFSPLLHQVIVEDCRDYSISPSGRAIALCSNRVAEGPRDELLMPLIEISTMPGSSLFTPRLSPDGQMIIFHEVRANATTVHVYVRMTNGSWQQLQDAPFGAQVDWISTFARGPTGDRVFVRTTDGIHEWAYEGSTWRDVLVETSGELGIRLATIQITSDGLRAVLYSDNALYYSDRPDESAKFRAAVPMSNVPAFPDAFLTEDCSRMYVSGLGSIFYTQQL